MGVGTSGLMSDYLNDLVLSGFVSRDHAWNPKTGVSAPLLFRYRLKDNYLRFYLKYIENKLPEIDRNVYQLKSLSLLSGWATIMGLQFENLVLNNRYFIHQRSRAQAVGRRKKNGEGSQKNVSLIHSFAALLLLH